MKRYYKNLSFLNKLSLINFSVGIPIILIIILIAVFFVRNEGKKVINMQLDHISTLTVSMVVSDLLFNDPESIEITLKSLSVFPNIEYACILNNQQEIIAIYGENNSVNESKLISKSVNFNTNNNLVIYKEIKYKSQILGQLVFISNISPFLKIIRKISYWLVIILCLLFLIWLIISVKLQKLVIKPILSLSNTMDNVVKTGNYDANLQYESYNDEVGHLYNDFNLLMTKINETTVSRNYLDNIMDALAEMLIVLDENNEIRTINDIVEKTTGFNLDFLLQKNPNYLITNCLEQIKSTSNFETFITTITNNQIPVSISVTTFINENGAKRTVLSIKNITEKRANQAELQQYYQKVEEKNQELAIKNQELERFTYIASHDMKTPLRTITGFISLIERRLKGQDPELLEYLSFVKDGATKLNNLIIDTLEFSKVENKDIQLADVDMNETINWINSNFDKDVQITTADLPNIQSNKSLLIKVFQNVIENGIKYNDATNKSIIIDYRATENEHIFSIKDNGIGIDSAYFDKIFVMYKRLHTNEKYQGTGLGLAICKKIVEQLGGNLTLFSEIGKGTTFFIKLPK